jgi:hypothetical protein
MSYSWAVCREWEEGHDEKEKKRREEGAKKGRAGAQQHCHLSLTSDASPVALARPTRVLLAGAAPGSCRDQLLDELDASPPLLPPPSLRRSMLANAATTDKLESSAIAIFSTRRLPTGPAAGEQKPG